MPTPQLTPDEIDTIRGLREEDELTFEQIGDRLSIDTSAAHRILTKPGYEFEELTLIRIRKGLQRLAEEQRPRGRKVATR
jgi:DNA-binding MarR family transcriptional regulator